jgi:hypothetical protein
MRCVCVPPPSTPSRQTGSVASAAAGLMLATPNAVKFGLVAGD